MQNLTSGGKGIFVAAELPGNSGSKRGRTWNCPRVWPFSCVFDLQDLKFRSWLVCLGKTLAITLFLYCVFYNVEQFQRLKFVEGKLSKTGSSDFSAGEINDDRRDHWPKIPVSDPNEGLTEDFDSNSGAETRSKKFGGKRNSGVQDGDEELDPVPALEYSSSENGIEKVPDTEKGAGSPAKNPQRGKADEELGSEETRADKDNHLDMEKDGSNVVSASGASLKPNVTDRYLGNCYEDCQQVRSLLLGSDYDDEKIERLRSVTCVHFVAGKGFCDSLITQGKMKKEVFTKGYMREGRKFFGNVSASLPNNVGGVVVFLPSDTTDDLLDHEIDALWDNQTPFLPHSIRRRETSSYVFMPDFHFIMGLGFQTFRDFIDFRDDPYEERSPVVFWRGSSTSSGLNCSIVEMGTSGRTFLDTGCAKTLRVRIALLALGIPHMNAKISAVNNCCVGRENDMKIAGILGDRVAEWRWTRYRGVIEVDGLVNAWGSFWRAYSGSVMFRVDSEYTNYCMDLLRPWVHYVPVKKDLSDLQNKTSMVLSNSSSDISRLSKMVKRARETLEVVTYSSEVHRVTEGIREAWGT